MAKVKVRKPQIALNLPSVVALLLIYVRHVIEMMTKNAALFLSPLPALADVTKHADDLETAEIAVKARTKGAAQVRDDKKRVVDGDMTLLKAYVFGIAAANPTMAATIIASAGMSEKIVASSTKAQFAALMGALAQEVILRAKAEKGRASYEWYYSADAGKSWVFVGSTPEAHITVKGLAAGVTYQFRYRTTVKGVTSDWSEIVTLDMR